MTFSTQDVQPSSRFDCFAFLFTSCLCFGEDFSPDGLIFFCVLFGIQTASIHFCYGRELCVAAQHDVGTTTGHVGGHGDSAQTSGIGNNGCFTRIVLGVEHLVFDASFG